ncbi:MAG TPA: prolipoprotein diacylglyceryl transferase [Thermoanaerobaculales bacterium]|nr:prolipoprotein diacylglyceryl transferase [Thermoanaerobaculales bacterium]HPA79310.1 prolipoprotein diacylglyceryl transferase [Thermoanaerobaculales bacterium]HQL31280.1 prolipoprotein diacylglyceryl transferase [Thermoanaerobaculales bacterium]HQN96149.1 prolipoprotein diacylglyceryl transferase [Thermoanaerobaculales bacterium]HQP42649.1 prolipoprotein diacylglyceryl transferase [Thermoanaerobaculales bacterium]
MHPILLDLGFFQVPSYGVLVALGVIAGLLTLKRRADRAGLDGARLVDVGLWLVIWALVGAKGLLVLVELPRYLRDPGELVGLVRAGGVFLGGFAAAVAAGVVLFRRYHLPVLATMDVFVPSVALGQAIGRVGCLMAGCCWGSRCDLPWAITYTDPAAAANVGTPLHVPLHPYPAYEALFNFALFVGLEALHRRRPAPGRVFAAYLLTYGAGRFALEWARGDAARGFVLSGALSTSQLISLGLVVLGTALLVRLPRRTPP